jgi:threonine-phosphate decarboxylase
MRHRIVVRDCSTYEGLEAARFMRVAVRNRADNERLIAALRDVLMK